MEKQPKIIGENIIGRSGQIERVEIYYEGEHPEMGAIVLPSQGLSGGYETVVKKERIPVIKTITVYDGK